MDGAPSYRTLEEVVAWALQPGSGARIAKILGQDEFTFDVVIAIGDRFHVYDVT